MPCYDPPTHHELHQAERALKEFRHNSPVAEIACSLMQIITASNLMDRVSPEALTWWEEHQLRDAEKGVK